MNIGFYYIMGQALTFVSYVVFWVSRYMKHKKNMLLYDNISRIIAIAAFLFLHTYDGIKNTVFVVFRNFVSNKIAGKQKKIKVLVFFGMLSCSVLLYATSRFESSTICIFMCNILNLYGVVMCDERGMLRYGMSGSVFYASFLLLTKNYVGFLCEVVCFFVMLTSYVRRNIVPRDIQGL